MPTLDGFLRHFSPLREGDTYFTHENGRGQAPAYRISVPFAKGTPISLALLLGLTSPCLLFQSPSRRGHLFHFSSMRSCHELQPISVPFAKGTPISLDLQVHRHLTFIDFSPLREGDTYFTANSAPWLPAQSHFSPL